MNKKELTNAIAERTGLSKFEIKKSAKCSNRNHYRRNGKKWKAAFDWFWNVLSETKSCKKRNEP